MTGTRLSLITTSSPLVTVFDWEVVMAAEGGGESGNVLKKHWYPPHDPVTQNQALPGGYLMADAWKVTGGYNRHTEFSWGQSSRVPSGSTVDTLVPVPGRLQGETKVTVGQGNRGTQECPQGTLVSSPTVREPPNVRHMTHHWAPGYSPPKGP